MIDECGIIFDIDHFAVHDGPGIRTVVYFKGCSLRCVWCHSPESHIKEPQMINVANGSQIMCGRTVKALEVVDEVIEDKIFFDSSGGGVTLSGGEVLFQPEFAEAILARLRDCGVHTVVETSGMGKWQDLCNIAKYTDIFYYDIKTLDNEKHLIYTGVGNKIILDNLKELAELMPNGGITLRVPLIPGYNDSIDEIAEIYKLAQELQIHDVHLLRYNTSAPAKYQWLDLPYKPGSLERQSDEYVDKLCEIAPEGINVSVF
jgi:pyruvate formate lyase activating enzyme